jgi:tRNA modification GTPase
MSYHPGDTICAMASAPGGAARGIVRISGRDALDIVARCFCADDASAFNNRHGAFAAPGKVGAIWWPIDASPNAPPAPPYKGGEFFVPCDAFVWPTSRSYTREPVVELHTLGSPPVLEAILAALCCAGARPAEAGEFTLRAFLAGRLDLTQAEAVLGVIDARGMDDLDAALRQMAGGIAGPLHTLRDDLLQLLAELEAGLDFAEEDIEFASSDEILRRVGDAGRVLDELAEQMAFRHTSNSLEQIALVGRPNVGKSSLFNALVTHCSACAGASQQSAGAAALVSPHRGTTRDYLTATISLDGISCQLVDMAGIEEPRNAREDNSHRLTSHSIGEIDDAAQKLAADRSATATIRALCVEASEFAASPRIDLELPPTIALESCDVIVLTKSDQLEEPFQLPADAAPAAPVIATSSRTGEGIPALCAAFRTLIASVQHAESGQTVRATADRCRESIRLASSALRAASEIVISRGGHELVAVEIRAALDELGKVVGAVYTEDLLDGIFSTFCIGK